MLRSPRNVLEKSLNFVFEKVWEPWVCQRGKLFHKRGAATTNEE